MGAIFGLMRWMLMAITGKKTKIKNEDKRQRGKTKRKDEDKRKDKRERQKTKMKDEDKR